MKRANEYGRAIRKFHLALLRRYGRPRIPPVREPIDELMYAVLSRWAPEGRAMAAVERLRKASIDLNDLRVTPVVELVATLGDDYPRARETAEALYRVLNGVFNRRYTLDLSFLKSMGKRDRERMISSVTGIDPHDSGMFLLRCFRGRHVPVSPDAFASLRHEGLVDREASAAEIRSLLAKVIPASQAEVFACLLKRHIAANPPPPELPPAPPPPPPVVEVVTKGNDKKGPAGAKAPTGAKAPAVASTGKTPAVAAKALPAAAGASSKKAVENPAARVPAAKAKAKSADKGRGSPGRQPARPAKSRRGAAGHRAARRGRSKSGSRR